MKLHWLAIVALTSLPAQAAWQNQLSLKQKWQAGQRWVLNHSSRNTRIFLIQHLPGLFSLPFICQVKSGGANSILLPEDPPASLEAGGQLTCPELLQLRASTKSNVSIYSNAAGPAVDVGGGDAEVNPVPKAKFTLRISGNSLQVLGTEGNPPIKIRQRPEGALVYLPHGAAELRYSAEEGAAKLVIGSIHARVGVRAGVGPDVNYIHPFQHLSAADLGVPLEIQSGVKRPAPWPNFGVDIQNESIEVFFLSINLVAGRPGEEVSLNLNGPMGKAQCRIYTRPTVTGEFAAAYEFERNSPDGTFWLKLHPDYRKLRITASCQNEKNILSFSPEVSATMPGAPVPPPATARPQTASLPSPASAANSKKQPLTQGAK